ncbi:hypothetical protein PoB_007163500 [Plakobranchus ocellatus]|uniref:Uncharacterized protein n=1 Tax=Plakobranchus ocellatus TaxID=259542 RepID=A0AAV4DLV1_9GAST|nr:hypothetical protein PoB_007163500 [Plakobranchus ocellatus]
MSTTIATPTSKQPQLPLYNHDQTDKVSQHLCHTTAALYNHCHTTPTTYNYCRKTSSAAYYCCQITHVEVYIAEPSQGPTIPPQLPATIAEPSQQSNTTAEQL